MSADAPLRRALVGSALLVAGAQCTLLVFGTRAAAAGIIVVHLLGVVAMAGLATAAYRRGERDPTVLILAVSTATLGLAGVVGTAVMAVVNAVFRRRTVPFEAWYAALFPQVSESRSRTLRDEIVLRRSGPGQSSLVAPFADIIRYGDVARKHTVLVLVADNFQPAFAPVLRHALMDDEPAIRVQAATTAAKVEARFHDRWIALQERLTRAPDDLHLAMELARHHETYAATGLLDAGRADASRERAIEQYRRYTELGGDIDVVASAVIRLLIEMARLREVEEWVNRLDPDRLDAASLDALRAGLFALGRYADLRRLCAGAPDNDEPASAIAPPAAVLWRDHQDERTAS